MPEGNSVFNQRETFDRGGISKLSQPLLGSGSMLPMSCERIKMYLAMSLTAKRYFRLFLCVLPPRK